MLLSSLDNTDCKILEFTNSYLTQTLSYGCSLFDIETNTIDLNKTIDHISFTETFQEPLFWKKPCFSYAIV